MEVFMCFSGRMLAIGTIIPWDQTRSGLVSPYSSLFRDLNFFRQICRHRVQSLRTQQREEILIPEDLL